MIVYSSEELDGEHHYLDPQPFTRHGRSQNTMFSVINSACV